MDYTYFGTAQQPYHDYAQLYPQAALDPDAVRSIEPLDAGRHAAAYDAFAFHGLPTPHHGSPEAGPAHASLDSGIGGDMDDARASRTRSSSEEKESLTPAQSRRKAQNRAAQRAFRERKERHVRDLENKLSALENSKHSLQSDNERLKLALQRARTENEILRATAGSPPSSRPPSASYPSPGAHLTDEDTIDDEYSIQALNNGSILNAADKQHPSTLRTAKGKEVPAAQAWDYIQAHPLVKQGLVDIADVCERLKGAAKCDGHGPVFEESTIWHAIQESRRCGGDELI